jgi:hypothetical protein
MFISFKLVEGASVEAFLLAAEKLNDEHMSKQKGYISWQQLKEGDTWVDLATWKTMADARNFLAASGNPDALAEKFYSFLDQKSIKMHLYSVEKSY